MFQATRFTRRKRQYELLARATFFLMTLLIVTPLILIVGYLIYQAWPILSLDFLITNPRNGMRSGGIWSPLLGTISVSYTHLDVYKRQLRRLCREHRPPGAAAQLFEL